MKTEGSGAFGPREARRTGTGPAADVSREFVTLKAHDGVDLYAQFVMPAGFNPAQKYPVAVHWYGGPGLQMVSNRYGDDQHL